MLRCLSTTGLSRMAAATLPFPNLDEVVTDYKIYLLVNGHWGRHIGEK
jgi:hypothetical protein